MAPIPEAPSDYRNKTVDAGTIALYARNAGFPDDQLVTAVAVALAESSGKVGVTHRNSNGSTDYGLWQINSIHTNLPNWASWYDGAQNAYMAKRIYDGSGWKAWTTYKSGAYRIHIPAATIGVTAGPTGESSAEDAADQVTQEAAWFRDTKDAIAQVGNAFAAIAQAVWKTAVWMADPHNWVRTAFVLTGGAMAIGAVVVMVKPNKSAVQAVTAAPKKIVSTVKAA